MSLGAYVDGWKGIAAHCGRSERWTRYMSKRQRNPLPVGRVGGVMRMYVADYDAWVVQEMATPLEDARHRRDFVWPRKAPPAR